MVMLCYGGCGTDVTERATGVNGVAYTYCSACLPAYVARCAAAHEPAVYQIEGGTYILVRGFGRTVSVSPWPMEQGAAASVIVRRRRELAARIEEAAR